MSACPHMLGSGTSPTPFERLIYKIARGAMVECRPLCADACSFLHCSRLEQHQSGVGTVAPLLHNYVTFFQKNTNIDDNNNQTVENMWKHMTKSNKRMLKSNKFMLQMWLSVLCGTPYILYFVHHVIFILTVFRFWCECVTSFQRNHGINLPKYGCVRLMSRPSGQSE